jgi:transcriptional regulator with XRE-family HTH domain
MLVDNMKTIREKAGLTQAALAKKGKFSVRNVQNWEQGHREPGVAVLRQLANLLGVTLDELTVDPKGKRK